MITNDTIEAVLILTETSGRAELEFTATIPSRSSGITFGRIQIDLATNQYGQEQFGYILDAAGLGASDITQLLGYVDVRRRDFSQQQIDDLPGALVKITEALNHPAAQAQLEVAIQKQLSAVARGVNQILTRNEELYPNDTTSVLHPDNPNYDYAIAYLIAAKNVNGYIPDILDLLAAGTITSVDVLSAAYPNVNFDALDEIARLGLSAIVNGECFLAGTLISMWDGTRKPIEQIRAGDIVVSYDKDGTRKPGRVTRTMTGEARQILDVHGMMMTPGHATLCGDGRFAGQHVPILDILRSDGALVREDGTKIRAGTGCPLGTMGDRMIAAISGILDPDGSVQITGAGRIRAGTRFITADGEDVSVLDLILKTGGRLTESGMIQSGSDGPEVPFLWTFTPSLPKPEDYVLQRSGTDLHDIYQANEWEAVRPAMPVPAAGEAGRTVSRHPALIAAAPVNVPLAMRVRPDAPQLSRKYRRAAEAKARKKGSFVH
jgi:hypothetical protein